MATLFRSISLKPCRGRRPRRPGNERIFNLHPAIIGSHVKSKICCFPDRRGRRSLQAKMQTASMRRYGAKTLSFPGRFKAIAIALRSRIDVTVNFVATLFRPIFLKPCRDRRPRRSGNERILKLHPAMIGSRIKSKICCFPDRRGRRSLQAKNSNRINTPIRSENLIVSGAIQGYRLYERLPLGGAPTAGG